MPVEWSELGKRCRGCTRCRLHETRTHVVVGRGDKQADILMVGEAPGRQEDEQGLPFVGQAGQLLDHLLGAVPFASNEYYITNIVKCRPPNNRDPEEREIMTCLPYLRMQFRLIQPKIVVCLGRIAAKILMDKNMNITNDRGQWMDKNGIRMMAVYHPAYLLRTKAAKIDMWNDFMNIREALDKQHGN